MNKKSMLTDFNTTMYDQSADWLQRAVVERAADGFTFTEGCVWHPDGYFLFSDTPANIIYSLQINGDTAVYLTDSGLSGCLTAGLSDQIGSNGIAIDSHQNTFICQHGNHAVAKLDKSRNISVLISDYNGRPFNSPNDVIIGPDGALYFTDPPYGLAGQVLHTDAFQPAAGIYRYKSGSITLIGTELQYPNGLVISADEQWLLVSSNHSGDPGILRYAMQEGSVPVYKNVFMQQHADGMTIDRSGLIYLATDDGILVADPDGNRLALITLPQSPSNVCLGGGSEDILMVTARDCVYFITWPGGS